MEKVRGKLFCSNVETYGSGVKVRFHSLYSNTPEDNSYAAATPSADMTMIVDNPGAIPFFVQGQNYYIDFTKAQ